MQELTDEFAAALALVRKHRPAAVTLRLSCDRSGQERLVIVAIEGITPRMLAAEVLDGHANLDAT